MDLRAKMNNVFKDSEDKEVNSKKEFTQEVISDLKEKISQFKNKKEQEKCSRKDELNFEINQDLINQFKKQKQDNQKEVNTTDSNLYSSLYREQPKEPKNLDLSTYNQSNLNQNRKSNEVLNNTTHSSSGNKPSTIQRAQTYGIGRNPADNLYSKENSIEQIRKPNLEEKKEEIFGYLQFKDNPKQYGDRVTAPSMSLNALQSTPLAQTTTSLYTTKDKVKDLFGKKEEKRRSDILKTPTYDYSSKASTRKFDICMTTDHFNQKQKKIDSLESFGDFNSKPPQEIAIKRTLSTDPFNIGKSNDFGITQHRTKAEFAITSSSIRAIANKLSFSSSDELLRMDKVLAAELVNLSHLINRTFLSSSHKAYM